MRPDAGGRHEKYDKYEKYERYERYEQEAIHRNDLHRQSWDGSMALFV